MDLFFFFLVPSAFAPSFSVLFLGRPLGFFWVSLFGSLMLSSSFRLDGFPLDVDRRFSLDLRIIDSLICPRSSEIDCQSV